MSGPDVAQPRIQFSSVIALGAACKALSRRQVRATVEPPLRRVGWRWQQSPTWGARYGLSILAHFVSGASCAFHCPPPSVVRTHPHRRSGCGTNAGEPEGALRIRRPTNASVRRIALGTRDPGNVGVCRLPSTWHWHHDEAFANRGFGMYAKGQWDNGAQRRHKADAGGRRQ